MTSTGVALKAAVDPLPSCPDWLRPQHTTAPPRRRAQV
jgi:hypothetical protein